MYFDHADIDLESLALVYTRSNVHVNSLMDFVSLKYNPMRDSYSARNLYVDGLLLTDLVITQELAENMKSYAFSHINLNSVTIAEGVTLLPKYCFYYSNVKRVVFESTSITEIPEHCFNSCKDLSVVVLSDSITTIKNMAFGQCLFEYIDLSNIQTIDGIGFYQCLNLKAVYITRNTSNLNAQDAADATFHSCSPDMIIFCELEENEIPESWLGYWNKVRVDGVYVTYDMRYGATIEDYYNFIKTIDN